MHHKLRLRDDERIDSTVFFEEEVKLAATLRNIPRKESEVGGETASGAQEENKDEGKVKVAADGSTGLRGGNSSSAGSAPVDEKGNLVFKVFDVVKVKVETTEEFPLDIKCSLMFSKEDLKEFEQRFKQQETAKLQ